MNNINRGGFTLVEVLVAVTILGILLVTAVGFCQYVLVGWQKSKETVEARNSLWRGIDCISRELRQARALESDMCNGNRLAFYSSENKLIQYYTEGYVLYRQSTSKQPVVNNIYGLNFEYGPHGLVYIKLVSLEGKSNEVEYFTAVRLRVPNGV